MKKHLIASIFAFLFLAALPSFSTEFDSDILARPHRIFEVGFDAQVAAANSSFNLSDFLQKNIEINFKKIAKDMPDDGFSLGFYDKEQFFASLNISSRFRFAAFANIEASSHFNLSRDLFDLLASGLTVGSTETVDVTGYADVFANIGASFQTIVNGYGIKITPTYFVPLMYVPKTTATGSLTTSGNGLIRARAEADVDIYTALSMKSFIENKKSADNLDFDYKEILSNGGFDLSLDIDRNWFHGFNAGLYTRIPVVGGKLEHKISTRVWASFTTENLLDDLLNDGLEDDEKHGYGYEEENGKKKKFAYSEDSYKVHRPLRFGFTASYAPFGEWLKIQPQLGFALRNPYSRDVIFYMEYALDFNISVVKRIFNFNLGTAYQNQIFQQRFGFSLNLRALEFITQVSMCGTNLIASFDRGGYGALVGFRMGF